MGVYTLKSSLFVFLVQIFLITGFKACIFATACIKLVFLKLADSYIYVCVHICIIHIHSYCIYNIYMCLCIYIYKDASEVIKGCYLFRLFLSITSVCVLVFDDFCGQNGGGVNLFSVC